MYNVEVDFYDKRNLSEKLFSLQLYHLPQKDQIYTVDYTNNHANPMIQHVVYTCKVIQVKLTYMAYNHGHTSCTKNPMVICDLTQSEE